MPTGAGMKIFADVSPLGGKPCAPNFSADLVEYAIGYYRAMLTAIENGALGGAIVFAERVA